MRRRDFLASIGGTVAWLSVPSLQTETSATTHYVIIRRLLSPYAGTPPLTYVEATETGQPPIPPGVLHCVPPGPAGQNDWQYRFRDSAQVWQCFAHCQPTPPDGTEVHILTADIGGFPPANPGCLKIAGNLYAITEYTAL